MGLGLATIAVLLISNTLAALIGRWLLPEVRIAVFVVVIAAAVTAVELTLAAWLPAIHAGLGIFLPLIVTNCLVLARAESFAARNAVWSAMLDALAMGVGFMLVLLALGASRELLGHGSLGAGLDDVLGPAWAATRIDVFPERHGLLLVLLPPGAFILLGLMLAVRNRLAQRRAVATRVRRSRSERAAREAAQIVRSSSGVSGMRTRRPGPSSNTRRPSSCWSR